jgi:hypothetical protein
LTKPTGVESTEAERRGEPRFDAAHPIIIEWQTREGELHRARGTTRNIALGGVYCVLERPLPVGHPVEFNLVFPAGLSGKNPVKLRCGGKVLRTEKSGHEHYGAAVSIESTDVVETLDASADPGAHRLYARIIPPGTLQAEYPGMVSVVRDVSQAGAFIEDERPLPVGRLFRLRLSSERLGKEIELAAIVRRVEPHVGMAVEFVSLTPEAKTALEEVVQQGRPWLGAHAAYPAAAPAGETVPLDETLQFLRMQAARVLPQLEVLACHYRVGDHSFSVHVRDPVSRAELLLPIAERWVRDAQASGETSRVDRVLGSANRILDLGPIGSGEH